MGSLFIHNNTPSKLGRILTSFKAEQLQMVELEVFACAGGARNWPRSRASAGLVEVEPAKRIRVPQNLDRTAELRSPPIFFTGSDVMLEGMDLLIVDGFSMPSHAECCTDALSSEAFMAGARNGMNYSVRLDEGRDAERSSLLIHPHPRKATKPESLPAARWTLFLSLELGGTSPGWGHHPTLFWHLASRVGSLCEVAAKVDWRIVDRSKSRKRH
jgi:hypothetical protein